jgi:hypothetical protein
MYRARARSAMIRTCDILQDIEEVSRSAAVMAEMGKATLKEMDRVYNEVAGGRQRRSGRGHGTADVDAQDELRGGNRTETLVPVPDHGELCFDGVFKMAVDWKCAEAVFPTPDASWASFADNNNNAAEAQGFDPSLPMDLADFDVFALFDPNFDLDGIDTLLGGNLDMSMPSAF